ncbi:Crp/Fnr family transcriptional regulator [Polaribacter sp. R77954]|uniref:Crp/Fnr family transcriptional regulator n=1 Tax=Polaribacter sp. R77954 TaxID=3093870 RepID=UPI0037C96CE6
MDIDYRFLSFLDSGLANEIMETSTIKNISKGTEILREEQYVKVLPIVINGLVKVYSKFNDKELLLYYIATKESCIMTFYAALKNTPSKVFAVTEEDSKILLLPVNQLATWLKKYPDFNILFYNQFNLRYSELLDTIGHLLLDKMDKRLYLHLKKKMDLTGNSSIKMSHNELASELGTAREVISRTLKKLELENKVTQHAGRIKIIDSW